MNRYIIVLLSLFCPGPTPASSFGLSVSPPSSIMTSSSSSLTAIVSNNESAQDVTVRVVTDLKKDLPVLHNLRRTIFIEGQGVPEEIEMDGIEMDQECTHFLAEIHQLDKENDDDNENNMKIMKPVGTARLKPNGQAGRIGVLEDLRGMQIGQQIMEKLETHAKNILQFKEIVLHSQSHACGFYEKCGYVAYGDEYVEAGIRHRNMRKTLP